jgi:putative ABC transport system permease protein
LVSGIGQSLRLAVRTLRVNPAFAIAATATLALGIAASTVMFSVTYGVLLRPLAYAESDRLVQLSERHADQTTLITSPHLSNVTFHAWNGRSRTIGPIAIYGRGSDTVGLDEPTRVVGASVSPSAFEILRVAPAVGRFFTADDALDNAAPVVVLSDGFWRERFGADPSVIGRALSINRRSHLIVGVAPRGFSFPDSEVRFWTPGGLDAPVQADGKLRVRHGSAIARLLPGISPEQAAAEGTAIAKTQTWPGGGNVEVYAGSGAPVEVRVVPISRQMTSGVRPAILLLLAGAGCLLLIACANVANLLLSRGASRERELAVMQALGASRGRVMAQLFVESLLLAIPGGALGVAAALVVVRALPAIAPVDFPRLADIRIDWTVAAFAVGVSALSGVLAGWMPAVRSGRADLVNSLRASAGATAARQTARRRRVLLVAEASLAMMLLALATVVGRGFVRLMNVNPGFNAERVLTARLFLPGEQLKRGEADQFSAALLERLRAMPVVQAAGAGWMTPFGGSTSATMFTIGAPGREKVTARSLVNVVTPGYAEALGLQLRKGRLLNETDLSSGRQSIVVNETFVRTFLGEAEPIGINVGIILSRGVEAEIVGVVQNVLREGLQTAPQPEVYVPPAHRYSVGGEMKLVVRTTGDPAALSGVVRQLVRDLRKDTAVDNTLPLAAQLSDSVRTERLAMASMAGLAAMSLVLAAIGLYGMLSYSVSTRRREIGIRAALGADRRDVVWLVLRDGLAVTAVGLIFGLAAGTGAARLIESQFFGVRAFDPAAVIAAPIALGVVALAACLIPARRAAAIEPATALRAE